MATLNVNAICVHGALVPRIPTPDNALMRHPLSRLIWVTAILLAAFFCASAARANGCYMPEQAYPAMPTIPVQRAIIVHRDGQETLIVESGVQSPSPTVGWILPLPAHPTRIEKADPGMLVSASIALRPELMHDLGKPWAAAPYLLVLLAPPLLVTLLIKDPLKRRAARMRAIGFSLVLAMGMATILPMLSHASVSPSSQPAGINVLSAQRVGDYDVTILKARSADDLSLWLTDRKLMALSPAGQSIADSYIAGNWCFAVAQLHLDGDKLAMPHPLSVTFPAAAPIFPMQLTALAQTTTRVELVVVASQQAQAPGFHLACCDRFTLRYGDWDASKTGLTIGHPAVAKLLWDDCIVSKLTADLRPAQMTTDVNIGLAPFSPYRDTAWTSRGRDELVRSILSYGALVMAIALAIAFRGRRWPSRSSARLLGILTLALLLTCGGVYVLLPVVPVSSTDRMSRMWARRSSIVLNTVLDQHIDELRSAGDTLGRRVVAIVQANPDTATNDLQGTPRRWEYSPGNLGLSGDDKNKIVLYDIDCHEVAVAVVPPAN